MTGMCRLTTGIVLASILSAGALQAQGRGGGAWTTVAGDAQRTSWQRADPKISPESMQKPGFQFLWKRKFDETAAGTRPLSQPLLLPNIIAYKGFKALAFVSAAGDNVYAVDYELNRMFWTQHLATGARSAATGACAAGPPALTKATALVPAAPGGRGRAAGPGGGAGRGAAPQGPVMPGGRDAADNVYAISSGGMIHLMNPQIGADQIPPIKFLPPGARVVGSILTDNVLYAATTGKCGGAPNGVWALDILAEGKPVTSFDTKGAGIAGAVAPTFGTDGTIYVATGSGDSPVANAVVALEPKTLRQKDWFTAGGPFTSAPVVFQHKGKDIVAAANRDGRIYLLDAAAPGGADHKTPLSVSTPFGGAADTTGLATWVDTAGTRWVVAAAGGPLKTETKFPVANGNVATGAIAAFTVVETGGVPTLEPQWVSGDVRAPLTPAVVNGVVFAVSGSEGVAAGRSPRTSAAVLHALDGATGKSLWTSGTTITTGVRVSPSGGDSQVYVAGEDGTLYAFGMPAER